MTQLTFAEAESEHKKRKTERELFLDEMEGLIPWKRLEKKVARYSAKTGSNGGRQRIRCRRCSKHRELPYFMTMITR